MWRVFIIVPMGGCMFDVCLYICTCMFGWMDGWMGGRGMDGWMDGRVDGWMGGRGMDGWMDGWVGGRRDGWMDGYISTRKVGPDNTLNVLLQLVPSNLTTLFASSNNRPIGSTHINN